MAKTTKSGLGRGLNSLLGGSYEEAVPAEQNQRRVTVAEEPPATAAPAANRTAESDVPKEKPVPAARKDEKSAVEKKEVPVSAPATPMDVEDAVVIVRPARTEAVVEKAAEPAIAEQKAPKTYAQRAAEVFSRRQVSAPAKGKKAVSDKQAQGDAEETVVEVESSVRANTVTTRGNNEVPVDSVEPNPDQPRIAFNQGDLEELAQSIRKNGMIQPILVRPFGPSRYQIIAGERRWQACRMAGLKMIPVSIRETDDDGAIELALVENLHRNDLNPVEEAYAYKRLMDKQGLTQSELAQMMSKGRSTIANAIRLLDLPESAQQLLFEEKITPGHARAILSIPSKEGREALTRKLMEEKLSVRETENIARLLANKRSEPPRKQPMPASYKKAARSLRRMLHTGVRVKVSGGKNRLEIEFKDEEDLQRLLGEFTSARKPRKQE